MQTIECLGRPQSLQEDENTTEATLEKMLSAFEQMWALRDLEDITDTLRIVQLTRRNLNIAAHERDVLQPREIEELWDRVAVFRLQNLENKFANQNMILDGNKQQTVEDRFARMYEILYHCGETLYNANRSLYLLMNRPQPTITDNIFRFRPMTDYDTCSPSLRFAIYVMKLAHKRQLRKQGDDVYEPIYNPKGQYTNAWKRVGTIHDLVFGCVDPKFNFHQLVDMAQSPNIASNTVSWITKFQTPMIPQLIINRYLLSWRNGIYNVKRNVFVSYENLSYGFGKLIESEDKFDEREVSVNYFDKDFTDWMVPGVLEDFWKKIVSEEQFEKIDFDQYRATGLGIPTPVIDSIFEEQEFNTETCLWLFGLLGRGLYWGGERDNWQCCLYLLGYGGTGKSSLLKLLRQVYPIEHIGFLSNNVEKQWAISTLYKALLVIGYELKETFKLDQAEFQSMVSLEEVSVAEKHKKAHSAEFKVPICVAGNEMVTYWRDASGSLARRIVSPRFARSIPKHKMRPRMFDDMMLEFPAFVQKINCAYRRITHLYSHREIHDVLPPQLKEMCSEAMESMNPLENFLKNGQVFFRDKDRFCKMTDFKKLFNSFCDSENIRKPQWNREFYGNVFNRHNLKVELKTLSYRGAPPRQELWIMGLDVLEDAYTGSDPHAKLNQRSSTSILPAKMDKFDPGFTDSVASKKLKTDFGSKINNPSFSCVD